MDKIIVEGGNCLKGDVYVAGSKNAALPILVSALLVDGECTFFNVPNLDDVRCVVELLISLGASVNVEDSFVKIDASGFNNYEAPYELVCKMRASVLVLAPLIARLGKAKVFLPGGCSIGARPIDLHLKALECLGARIELKNGYVNAIAKNLKGANILFDVVTVTGTENLMMAAVLADGITVLRNAALEPEVVALSRVLNSMGGKVHGAGTSTIVITGVKRLHKVEASVIPDRVEAGTFMVASALTGGDVNVHGCMPENLGSVINNLRLVGALVDVVDNSIRVRGNREVCSIDVTTLPYPGFPTDMQAIFMVLMSISNGVSVISETVFKNRFVHVGELNRMGANIKLVNCAAIVKGVSFLFGTKVVASDLRAAASLILAGLVAVGQTKISKIYHLDRGYDCLEKKIKKLGGNIKRVNE